MNRIKKLLPVLLPVILFACMNDNATIRETVETFVTYPFSDPDAIPRPERDYYPYFRFDGYTDEPDSVEWKVIVMENKYVKVTVFPELGGKIWGATEKSTGNEFIYNNSVVKFRDIGMRGPWTSGGIELNFGPIAHTPAHSGPVDYLVRTNDDGSVSCFVGTYDLITRARWEVEINLESDKAYFTTSSSYSNPTSILQPYWTWSTAAYQTEGGLEFYYPGNYWVGHNGDVHRWPVDETGRDLSVYEKNDFGSHKSYHIIGGLGDYFAAYWHDLNFGAGQHALYGDRLGKKIWLWALSRSGGIWEDLLTDTDGQYVEMQGGRRFNQSLRSSTRTPFKHLGFIPFGNDIIKEYWYPIMNIGGVVRANSVGALNVVKEAENQTIYFSPLQPVKDSIKIYSGRTLMYNERIDLKPLEVWEKSIPVNSACNPLRVVIGNNSLVYTEEPDYELSNRPVESPEEFDWNSVYGLYVDGLNYVYQGMYDNAFQRFNQCLESDPLYAPALNQMAELYFRKADYESAHKLTVKSLSINAYDPGANYLFGLTARQLNNMVDAHDGFAVAAIDPSFRTASYIELARLFIFKNDLPAAEEYTRRVLDQDKFNQEATLLAAVIARKSGNLKEAEIQIANLEALSPLNHFARFERFLLKGDRRTMDNFVSMIRTELPNETFMEMSHWYDYVGSYNDAIKLLELSPGNPLIYIQLAYLNHTRNPEKSGLFLEKAMAEPPDFVFPFRRETVPALEWLNSKTTGWKPKYYLGLLHWSLGNREYARDLFDDCGHSPESPWFYFSKADLFKGTLDYDAEKDLVRATDLGGFDWRTHSALLDYYLGKNRPEEALKIAEQSFHKFPSNGAVRYNYAKCLLANRMYSESLDVLENALIMPFEGASFGRITYRQAAVMEAIRHLHEQRTEEALESVKKARHWPENLGVGRPYDVDERIEDFIQAEYYLKIGRKEEADVLYNKIIAITKEREGRHSPTDFLYVTSLRRMGMGQQADRFLYTWQQSFPGDPVNRWIRAMLNRNHIAAQNTEREIWDRVGGSMADPGYAVSEFSLVKEIAGYLGFAER